MSLLRENKKWNQRVGEAWVLFSLGVTFLPPATKLGQGNIFRSVCQQFCPQGGRAWFFLGVGDMHGFFGGRAWFFRVHRIQ